MWVLRDFRLSLQDVDNRLHLETQREGEGQDSEREWVVWVRERYEQVDRDAIQSSRSPSLLFRYAQLDETLYSNTNGMSQEMALIITETGVFVE